MDQSSPSSESEFDSRLDNGGNLRSEANVNNNPRPVPSLGPVEAPETVREGDPLLTAQPRKKALLLVGDPGLGRNNTGRNFQRVADTRKGTLRREGYDAISVRVSSVTDIKDALTRNGKLDLVEYYGHSSSIALNPGENPGEDTNLKGSNLNRLSKENLKPGCRIVLYSCNAGKGHDSIAAKMAAHLGCQVEGYDGPTRFSTNPARSDGMSPPPREGPLYSVPEYDGVRKRTFEAPRRSSHSR